MTTDDAAGTAPIRVALVDDQQLVRAGFALVINSQPDMEVVLEAGDGAQALRLLASHAVDVVLMDIRMPTMDGLAATADLTNSDRFRGPTPKVVILTTFDLDEYVFDALRAGASGFLLKDAPAEDLVQAVRVVARGEALLSPSITRSLIAEFVSRPPRSAPDVKDLDELTDRELEVMRLVAGGLSNAEIAAEIYVAEQTVKTHVSRVLMKLGLRDRTQIVVAAYESGLIQPGS